MLGKYAKEVKLVFKNFPLSMHSFARKAAGAALAANRQGKFWEFHHKLFASASLNDAGIQDIAKQLGLDMEKFNKDLNDTAIQAMINRDLAEGNQAEVRGTPAVFVNGKPLKNRSFEGFRQTIEAELKKKNHQATVQ